MTTPPGKIDEEQLTDVLIRRAVHGEESPWPKDPYEWKGSFESTFDGDKQILLWAIDDCAQRGVPIPVWAANELHRILFYGVARGKIESWEDAFGKIRTDRRDEISTRLHMAAVWMYIHKLRKTGCTDWEEMYEKTGKKFGLGMNKAKAYYEDMQAFMKVHGPAVCMELDRKPIRD